MKRSTMYAAAIYLILGLAANAHAIGLEVAIGGWSQDPSGQLS